MALVALTRTAAEEYGEGIVDGRVAELHEYQDAWGFLEAAKAELAGFASEEEPEVAEAAAAMRADLAVLEPAFPGLVPEDGIETDASLIHGAAARMEIAARRVE